MAERRGAISAMLMFLVLLAVIAAVIVISQGIVVKVGLELPTILTDMPTFYEYDGSGSRAIEAKICDYDGNAILQCRWETDRCNNPSDLLHDPKDCHMKPSHYVDFYWLLAGIGVSIMLIVLSVAVLQYIAEGTGFADKSRAIENVKRIIPYIVIILIIPTIWDPFAIMIENAALFLMAPFPPEADSFIDAGLVGVFVDGETIRGQAQLRSAWLMMEAGSIIPPSVWQPETLAGFIFDPAKAVNNVLTGAFLGVFKAYVVIMLGLEMWVSGVVRVMATMMTVMAMPIMLPLSLIPKFGETTKKITDAIFGLSIAPIFSALVFTIGLAYLSASRSDDELLRWLQAVCVCFLCSAAVTTLAGGFFMNAESKVRDALKTALTSASMTVAAVASGGAGAAAGLGAAGAGIGGNVAGIAAKGAAGVVSATVQTATQTAALSSGKSSHSGPSSGAPKIMPDATQAGTTTDGGYVPGSFVAAGAGRDTAQADMLGAAPDAAPDAAPGTRQRGGDTVVADGGMDALPKEAKNRQGKAVKRPERLRTSGPSKWDYAKAFLMGAISGGVAPMMQGSMPGAAGMDKMVAPLSKKATAVSADQVKMQNKEFRDSSDYFEALKDQNESDRLANAGEKMNKEGIKRENKDDDSDGRTPGYIG